MMDLSRATTHPSAGDEYDLPDDDEQERLTYMLARYGIGGVLEAIARLCPEELETSIEIAWVFTSRAEATPGEAPAAPPKEEVLDLMAALKASLGAAKR